MYACARSLCCAAALHVLLSTVGCSGPAPPPDKGTAERNLRTVIASGHTLEITVERLSPTYVDLGIPPTFSMKVESPRDIERLSRTVVVTRRPVIFPAGHRVAGLPITTIIVKRQGEPDKRLMLSGHVALFEKDPQVSGRTFLILVEKKLFETVIDLYLESAEEGRSVGSGSE